MYTSMYSAVSGVRTTQMRMDTIGNNIANVDTPGFKGKSISFGSMLAQEYQAQPTTESERGRLTPPHLRVGPGVMASIFRKDMDEGTPISTYIDTDLSISGDAFFGIEGENGETRLTRSGAFQLMNNEDGQMVLGTPSGKRVLDVDGNPIAIPEGYRLQVEPNGQVLFVNKGNQDDILNNGIKLAIYGVNNRQLLVSQGDNEYSLPEGINPQLVMDEEAYQVRQGVLEGSNVDLPREMANLIETQRTFTAGTRAISMLEEMTTIINNINK